MSEITNDITEGMWARMPQAVEDYIQRLVQRIQDQDATIRKLQTVATRDTTDGIIINPYAEHPLQFPLDDHIRVWLTPGKFAVDVSARPNLYTPKKPTLTISGYGNASSGCISVLPSAVNVVHIQEKIR